MAEPHRINDERRHVTFHARVAGVALITAVAVLMAACLTFMLQQWVVAREQSRATHTALAQIIAESAAPSLAAHDGDSASAALSASGVR